MDWEEPKAKKAGWEVGGRLDGLSIGELVQLQDALRIEIERIEAEVGRKRAHEAAASKLFKS
ncbi:MAG: DUF1192 domain-containing protein [Hyphomicrobium sp.]|nr:DUF1192 domain-containing protein [Hyphomicrobium sp.]